MKRKLTALLAALCITAVLPVHAGAVDLPLTSRAAVLMEKTTGQMLFAQNEHEKLEPASVTKIMTLLLTMDAIDSGALAYDDVVTVSANAAGMGGSQVFLAEGEQITVEELLKCVCVSSGNDAAVALPETGVTAVVEKAQASSLEYRVDLPETLAAPIQQGQQVGTLTLCSGDTEVLTVPILAAESVPGRSWGRMFTDLLKQAVFLA